MRESTTWLSGGEASASGTDGATALRWECADVLEGAKDPTGSGRCRGRHLEDLADAVKISAECRKWSLLLLLVTSASTSTTIHYY